MKSWKIREVFLFCRQVHMILQMAGLKELWNMGIIGFQENILMNLNF
ncbi:hypothetical protein SAMN05720473_101553 [Fibrobacter sp. UWB15]|nr:hypothetical protein BGW99_101553 [Fibrobacter sp. UWB6]SHF74652.1 hypothetical protein SAMN05720760_101518 [Fibrobacter sp. UWB8]SMG13741.1 hypothetical protein SAMN05720473_101553 [Fibrobacter sp. UWB15]